MYCLDEQSHISETYAQKQNTNNSLQSPAKANWVYVRIPSVETAPVHESGYIASDMAQTIDSVAGCDIVQSEISKESRSSTGNNNNNNNNIRCCAGCGCKIMDRFLLHAVDRFWHTGCLKCSCCSVQLGEVGPSCFSRGGMILCKTDYIRLFGVSGACAACAQQIPASELVMRTHNKVYHLKCFSCSSCHIKLVPGDRYTLINGSLVCENDHSKLFKTHGMSSAVSGFRPGNKVC